MFSFFTIPQFSKKIKRKIKFFTVHLGGYFLLSCTSIYHFVQSCITFVHCCTTLLYKVIPLCVHCYDTHLTLLCRFCTKLYGGVFCKPPDFMWIAGRILPLTTRLNNKSFITRQLITREGDTTTSITAAG